MMNIKNLSLNKIASDAYENPDFIKCNVYSIGSRFYCIKLHASTMEVNDVDEVGWQNGGTKYTIWRWRLFDLSVLYWLKLIH